MKTVLLHLIILSSLVAIPDGNTATVYQWTDADGIVNFSDKAPVADSPIDTREIEFDSFDNDMPAPKGYSIIEQANIMAKWRRQEAEHRISLKKLALEREQLILEMELDKQQKRDSMQDRYQPGVYYYGLPSAVGYRSHRPWNNRKNQWQNLRSHSHNNRPRENVSDYVKNGKGLQLYMSGRVN